MARKRNARLLTVKSTEQLTTHMRRVTLAGEDLDGFPSDVEGGYVKLLFAGETADQPVLRTYTVSQQRYSPNELDIDFMLHVNPDGDVGGVAAAWATSVQVGEQIGIMGPGPATTINTDAQWFLLAADMTALPAMTANLKHLPDDAKGHLVIEIISEDDKQTLPTPNGIDITWVINDSPGSEQSLLADAIQQLDWPTGSAAVWVACEFKSMQRIRQFVRDEKTVPKSHRYISSYWKKGLQEEAHKIAKKEDASN